MGLPLPGPWREADERLLARAPCRETTRRSTYDLTSLYDGKQIRARRIAAASQLALGVAFTALASYLCGVRFLGPLAHGATPSPEFGAVTILWVVLLALDAVVFVGFLTGFPEPANRLVVDANGVQFDHRNGFAAFLPWADLRFRLRFRTDPSTSSNEPFAALIALSRPSSRFPLAAAQEIVDNARDHGLRVTEGTRSLGRDSWRVVTVRR